MKYNTCQCTKSRCAGVFCGSINYRQGEKVKQSEDVNNPFTVKKIGLSSKKSYNKRVGSIFTGK